MLAPVPAAHARWGLVAQVVDATEPEVKWYWIDLDAGRAGLGACVETRVHTRKASACADDRMLPSKNYRRVGLRKTDGSFNVVSMNDG